MAEQATVPTVLVDVPDEPIENFCWVEKTAEVPTGEAAAAFMLDDETLFDPSLYDDPCTLIPIGTARLRLSNPGDGYEEQRWEPAVDGIEFWRLERVDAEQAL